MEELSRERRGNEGAVLRSMAKTKPNKPPRKPLRGQRKHQLSAPSHARGLTDGGPRIGRRAGRRWTGGSVLGTVAGFSQELPVTRPRGEPARDEPGAGSKRAHAGLRGQRAVGWPVPCWL